MVLRNIIFSFDLNLLKSAAAKGLAQDDTDMMTYKAIMYIVCQWRTVTKSTRLLIYDKGKSCPPSARPDPTECNQKVGFHRQRLIVWGGATEWPVSRSQTCLRHFSHCTLDIP